MVKTTTVSIYVCIQILNAFFLKKASMSPKRTREKITTLQEDPLVNTLKGTLPDNTPWGSELSPNANQFKVTFPDGRLGSIMQTLN